MPPSSTMSPLFAKFPPPHVDCFIVSPSPHLLPSTNYDDKEMGLNSDVPTPFARSISHISHLQAVIPTLATCSPCQPLCYCWARLPSILKTTRRRRNFNPCPPSCILIVIFVSLPYCHTIPCPRCFHLLCPVCF